MVVWVFAGGGETEARGLLPFLESLFPNCIFERKFPVGIKKNPLKPRSVIGRTDDEYRVQQRAQARGATGNRLTEQIGLRLSYAISHGETCDLILVFDDLDCRDSDLQSRKFKEAIESVVGDQFPTLICFAAPEIESWIIADWDHAMSQHAFFKSSFVEMKLCLQGQHNVSFDNPESFSEFDISKGSCRDKLSAAMQQCATEFASKPYSKGEDSSYLIKQLDPEIVRRKCRYFRELFVSLTAFCNNGNSPV